MIGCPVCGHQQYHLILDFKNYPIYQHPVNADVAIAQPHLVDLQYHCCSNCHHAFVPEFDYSALENLYRNFYYTPNEGHIAQELIQDFLKQTLVWMTDAVGSVLEIGCSSGETLLELGSLLQTHSLFAYEPNKENAVIANKHGIKVNTDFFNQPSAAQDSEQYDLIFARHVIEHIPDFDDFFKALDNVSHAHSQLILETPCLDFCIENRSIVPFHVEHLHVFSLYSLNLLASNYGWALQQFAVTEQGNQILCWSGENTSKSLPAFPSLSSFTDTVQGMKQQLQQYKDKELVILYGAGAGGMRLLSLLGLKPTAIIDGNRNKTGKVFFGFDHEIEYAPDFIKHLVDNEKDVQAVVIIGSMFDKEIRQFLQELHFKGKIISPYRQGDL